MLRKPKGLGEQIRDVVGGWDHVDDDLLSLDMVVNGHELAIHVLVAVGPKEIGADNV
jgi:hypothetical protein